MRIFARPLLFSALAIALLAYASWRLYRSAGQVEARVSRAIKSLVTTSPRLEGCEAPLFGVLSIRRLELPASPVIVERNLLELEDLRLEDPTARSTFRFRREASADLTRPILRVARGRLALERQITVPAGLEVVLWNVTDVFATPAWLEVLEGRHAQVLVETLEVNCRNLRPLAAELRAELVLKEVEIRPTESGGVMLEADLAESSGWGGGRLRVTWLPRSSWRIQAAVDGLVGVERWLSWTEAPLTALWERFRPQGLLDLDIEDLTFTADGKWKLAAVVEHYNTQASLGSTGLSVERLQGRMRLEATEASFPAPTLPGGGIRGEILGMACELEGSITPLAANLEMRLRPGPVEALLAELVREPGGPLPELLDLVRPAGSISGNLTYGFSRERAESLRSQLRITDGTLKGLGILSGLTATLAWDHAAAPDGAPGGERKLSIQAGEVAGLGSLAGEIRFRPEPQGLAFELSDLRVARKAGSLPPGGEGERTEGSVFASGLWQHSSGLERLEMRWLALPIELGFLRAAASSGDFARSAAGASASGKIKLGPVEIPAGLLTPTEAALTFGAGEASFQFEGGAHRRVVVTSLRLRGEKRSALAQGEISIAGEVSLLVFLAEGPSHESLWGLPAASRPADWRAAAGSGYRTYRIAGNLLKPWARELGDMDPAFGEAATAR